MGKGRVSAGRRGARGNGLLAQGGPGQGHWLVHVLGCLSGRVPWSVRACLGCWRWVRARRQVARMDVCRCLNRKYEPRVVEGLAGTTAEGRGEVPEHAEEGPAISVWRRHRRESARWIAARVLLGWSCASAPGQSGPAEPPRGLPQHATLRTSTQHTSVRPRAQFPQQSLSSSWGPCSYVSLSPLRPWAPRLVPTSSLLIYSLLIYFPGLPPGSHRLVVHTPADTPPVQPPPKYLCPTQRPRQLTRTECPRRPLVSHFFPTMSRSRLPPTPAMSGELTIKEQVHMDGTDAFALPPAAISPSKLDAASRRSSKSDPLAFCPASPASPELGPGRQPQPPRQNSIKRPLEDFDLPPPPTRTRKIIQMKPKTQAAPKPSTPAAKSSAKDANNAKNPSNNASQPASKKKQPSATSAAGRKIARKTAHSLIERRRRSKMNEEFSTLKNMIPACRGQEMHKLAILQASIDYVNYLETCIHDLKTAEGSKQSTSRMPPAPPSPASPEVLEDVGGSTYSASVSPELLPDSHLINMTSPAFSPRSHAVPSSAAFEPTPSILPSPALGPSYLTDPRDLSRSSWTLPSSSTTSPVIQPERRGTVSADIDHEASAALLMLNRECRRSISSIQEEPASGRSGSGSVSVEGTQDPSQVLQRKRMSVKDLLIS